MLIKRLIGENAPHGYDTDPYACNRSFAERRLPASRGLAGFPSILARKRGYAFQRISAGIVVTPIRASAERATCCLIIRMKILVVASAEIRLIDGIGSGNRRVYVLLCAA